MKSLDKPIHRFGLIANSDKPCSRAAMQSAVAAIGKSGGQVVTESATAAMGRLPEMPVCRTVPQLARRCDVLLVFGGDGTILRVARDLEGARTPVLGINIGRLGFLTEVQTENLESALLQVDRGDFALESRSMIEATMEKSGNEARQVALNDFVISRGVVSRMIELEVRVDGVQLTRYRCDGLIVSTPTGSTAYSMAAGGAIVSPTADVFAVTPICPHTLSNRSVIVSLRSVVEVRILSRKLTTMLTADGQVPMRLSAGDTITIRRSTHSIRLLRLAGSNFFDTLRRKLGGSGSNV